MTKQQRISRACTTRQGAPSVPVDPVLPKPVSLSVWDIVLLLGIIAFGFALRVYDLGFREAHLDESINLRILKPKTVQEFITSLLTVDCHPPLNYLLQMLFYAANPTLASVRFLSVLMGTAAIPLTFWAVLPVLGKRTSLAAAFVCATSFILVWYSREVRNYSLFYALSIVAFGYFIRLLQQANGQGRSRNLTGFAVSMLLCLYVHANTLLMMPVFACLFFIWEWRRHAFRPALLLRLAIVGVVLMICSIPVFYQYFRWSPIHGIERFRPTVAQLMDSLSSMGWGNGWRLPLWGAVMLGGFVALFRVSSTSALLFAVWVVVPIVGYLYVLGLPSKFACYLFRYLLFLQIGLIALAAACADGVARLFDSGSMGNRRIVPYAVVMAILAVALLSVCWTPYSEYYRMKASQENRGQVTAALKSAPFGRVLVDNYYYWSGSLREFHPPGIRIAYPPVFGNPDDYASLQVASYIRAVCEQDPLLSFFETGTRGYARKNVSWDWTGEHFAHHEPLFNKEAYALAYLGLNYFSYLDMRSFSNYVYRFNTLADLTDWFRSRNRETGIVPGEGWSPVSFLSDNPIRWHMWYAMDREASILVYTAASNASVNVAFDVQAGATVQQLSVKTEAGTALFNQAISTAPPGITRLPNGPSGRSYVPVSRLIDQNEGALPFFGVFQFYPEHITFGPVAVPPGLSILRLQCSGDSGLLLSNLTIMKGE